MPAHAKGYDTLRIAIGATASSVIDMRSRHAAGVQVPALGTTATVTVTGSNDGTNFAGLYDAAGNQLGVWATATAARLLDADTLARFFPYLFLKITLSAAQATATDIIVSYVNL